MVSSSTGPLLSVIDQLGLSPAERAAARKQGFVSAEVRSPQCTVYKLRFRHDGRQRVRYLGVDAAVAERLRQELVELQRPVVLRRQLRALTASIPSAIRRANQLLLPLVEQAGYHFHGRQIRKCRATRDVKAEFSFDRTK